MEPSIKQTCQKRFINKGGENSSDNKILVNSNDKLNDSLNNHRSEV